MKVRIFQSVAFIMAVLLLVASVGFNADFHYCGGELKSFSFIGKAESCHKNTTKPCPIHQKMMITGNFNCCNNETVYFHSDQDLQYQVQTVAKDYQFEKLIINTILPISFFQKTRIDLNFHPPPDPDPPRQREDMQVWNQFFLC